MSTYVRRLTLKTIGTGIGSLTALALAAQPFDVLTFNWTVALTVSGSAAVLALLEGLAGKFTGDPERPRISE